MGPSLGISGRNTEHEHKNYPYFVHDINLPYWNELSDHTVLYYLEKVITGSQGGGVVYHTDYRATQSRLFKSGLYQVVEIKVSWLLALWRLDIYLTTIK